MLLPIVDALRSATVLSLGTVGDAGLAVGGQDKIVWAGTAEGNTAEVVGRDEAEMCAATIAVSARVVVVELLDRVEDVNVIGPVSRVAQHCVVFAGELVRPHNGLEVPICPEQAVVNDGQGKDMRHHLLATQNEADILPVKVGGGDVVQVGISPPDAISEEIDGQGIGPCDPVAIHRRQDSGECVVTAIHPDATNVCVKVPAGEEDEADARVNHDGTRIWKRCTTERVPTFMQLPIVRTYLQS